MILIRARRKRSSSCATSLTIRGARRASTPQTQEPPCWLGSRRRLPVNRVRKTEGQDCGDGATTVFPADRLRAPSVTRVKRPRSDELFDGTSNPAEVKLDSNLKSLMRILVMLAACL